MLSTRDFSFNDAQAQSGEKKIFHTRGIKKEQGQLISNKIVFKQKTVTKDNEGYYMMTKCSINQKI